MLQIDEFEPQQDLTSGVRTVSPPPFLPSFPWSPWSAKGTYVSTAICWLALYLGAPSLPVVLGSRKVALCFSVECLGRL